MNFDKLDLMATCCNGPCDCKVIKASNANVVHSVDAARHSEMMGCIKLQMSYEIYKGYLMQAMQPEYLEFMTVSKQLYSLAAKEYQEHVRSTRNVCTVSFYSDVDTRSRVYDKPRFIRQEQFSSLAQAERWVDSMCERLAQHKPNIRVEYTGVFEL